MRDEQDGRGDEGVEEVLDGGAAAIFGAAEGGDQQRHRDEGELPEGVVEEEVERDEDAEHRDLLEQEEGVEELLAVVDDVPGDEDAEWGEEAGEHDEPHREAIDADVVVDGGRVDPGEVLVELEGAGRRRRSRSGREGAASAAKVTRVTASAPHCISLPLSGSRASRTAPASGTKVMTVRMVWSMFIVSFSGARTRVANAERIP